MRTSAPRRLAAGVLAWSLLVLALNAWSRRSARSPSDTRRPSPTAIRAIERREEERREISRELDDGPAQVLGFALLRLDWPVVPGSAVDGTQPADLAAVQRAIADALAETRAIASRLRTPHLAGLGLEEVIERAVRDHRRLAGGALTVRCDELPDVSSLALRIVLFRALRESLGYVAQARGAAPVAVRVRGAKGWLELSVSGPTANGTQGPGDAHVARLLERVREGTELLGGSCRLTSRADGTTAIDVAWPLADAVGRRGGRSS